MGLQTLGEERVRFHSQALMGQPAVHPPTKFVRQQLMTVPVIESVRFGYASPRCMTVHVTERRPYFLLEGQKGQLLVGDRQGVIFRAEPSRSPQMPFVHVISEKEWTVGDRIPPEHVAKIRAAFAIIQRTHFPMPERFYYNNGFLSLRLADQTLVRLGKEDWEKKLLRARRAFAFFEKTGQMPEYLDFTSLHVPTWKPKKVN
jgi:cell division septal protein FtsQ